MDYTWGDIQRNESGQTQFSDIYDACESSSEEKIAATIQQERNGYYDSQIAIMELKIKLQLMESDLKDLYDISKCWSDRINVYRRLQPDIFDKVVQSFDDDGDIYMECAYKSEN